MELGQLTPMAWQKVEGQSVQELTLQRGPWATRELGKPQRCWIACILWKDILQ